MTPTEALARIAANCDELETDAHPGRLIAQVRAVLAEVTPESGDMADQAEWYRDALLDLMEEHIDGIVRGGKGPFADAILALVRPVAGVTLTPDEAEWAAFALRKVAPDFGAPFQRDVAEKLAARLEATR